MTNVDDAIPCKQKYTAKIFRLQNFKSLQRVEFLSVSVCGCICLCLGGCVCKDNIERKKLIKKKLSIAFFCIVCVSRSFSLTQLITFMYIRNLHATNLYKI